MKKLFTLSTFALASIFLLSNFSSITHNNGQFIFTLVDNVPVLPSTPYNYSDIDLPDHLTRPDIDFGYGGSIDSTFIEELNDDVATLGRVLFYDKKLSALENISCASCHNQASSFADNVAFSEGVNTDTKRNSMQLNDIGWTDNHSFFWDMSQNDIREMIRLPLKDENEIGADMDEIAIKLESTPYYTDLFLKAFNSSLITEDKIVEDIVQFMESMTTFNSRFDQLADDNLNGITELESFGLELFSSFCSECHSEGNQLSIFGLEEQGIAMVEVAPFLFNNGLPPNEDDLGVGEWNVGSGLDHLFKAPTLRNIELTGPYMHDGSLETLEDVINFYSEESMENEWSFIIPDGGFQFSVEEKEALLAFLKTLTDHTFINDEKFSDPFDSANSIDPTNVFGNIIVKPNPMGDFSTIEFDAKNNEVTQLKITNNVGQEISNHEITGNTFQLNKADFGSGIYYLNFIRGKKTSTQKLIVH